MSSVNEGDIAIILRNDVGLVYEWQFFYHNLDLKFDNTPALKESWQRELSSYNLMRAIIGQWVSEKDSAATVGALSKVLEQLNHNYIKGVLLHNISPACKVEPIHEIGEGIRPTDDVLDETEEYKFIQQKTSGGVAILQLAQNSTSKEGKGRVLIFITHLLSMLTEIVDRPVAIISINGKQRAGKSFMANQFIKYLKFGDVGENWIDEKIDCCFEWRDDYERVTSGIQVWFEPLYVKAGDKEVAVIVMDTQGLHDEKTGAQENAIIFGLSALLSSVFIFNEKSLAQDSLQFLHSYLEFAKFASGDVGPVGLVFQKLIVLLRDFGAKRDFAYGYYDDVSCPPNQPQNKNLKQKMFDLTLNSEIHPESQKTRSGIVNCFEEIGVYAMRSPGNQMPDEAEYQSSLTWDSEFRSCIIDFVTKVFCPEALMASTKRVFGHQVSGKELMDYISKWVQLILDADGTVESKTVFEITAEMFYTRNIEESSNEYRERMLKHLDDHPSGILGSDFIKFHENLIGEIKSLFYTKKGFGGISMLRVYKKKLAEKINEIKDEIFKMNDAKLVKEQQRLQRQVEVLEAKLRESDLVRQRLVSENSSKVRELELQRQMREVEFASTVRQSELEKQTRESKIASIAATEACFHQYVQEFQAAVQKLLQIVNNRTNYRVERDDLLYGFISLRSDRIIEYDYSEDDYQNALQPAQAEVNRTKQAVDAARSVIIELKSNC